ncbi:uncharacterized protein [Triticum aestivum]|uniref:uncharacterized protein n=1 Tax=Triticum aestivum TaxID=4565 RepID=UPI001D035935|nr:uncharacterized protein LOC123050608 [Triticum aestivum]
MGDHHNMGNVEQHLGNTAPTTLLHYQLSDMWRSPRGTVLRIEGLALVAIACSFFLAAFGSCRRWSNRWIIQKGFLVAQVLSLSLGTYSIGLMQSSSVKSEMYPIWAVSLFTLLGCVDPVTTYIGLEYKGPLFKMTFQLCLYCGYVLLMSVSTISRGVGKLAIDVLSAITFIKGIHMSLALVQPSRTRDQLAEFVYSREPGALAARNKGLGLEVHLPFPRVEIKEGHIKKSRIKTSMDDVRFSCKQMVFTLQLEDGTANNIEDVCLGYSLSHLLQRHFLGLDTSREMESKIEEFERITLGAIDYKRTLKAIEVELAFLYEIFYTSNGFLHYDEAKTSSFWAFASFIGICFVGVATAIPGAMSSHHSITGSNNSPGASTIVVNTTTADLIITLVILVSLALLQLVRLIRCWTSNWARVAFACEYARRYYNQLLRQAAAAADPEVFEQINSNYKEKQISWWMGLKKFAAQRSEQIRSNSIDKQLNWWVRLKAFVVTRMNWFDKYLWQDKLGQYSLVDEAARRMRETWYLSAGNVILTTCLGGEVGTKRWRCAILVIEALAVPVYWTCHRFSRMLGLQYIGRVLRELLAHDTNTAVMLHSDVKASIADFLGKIKSRRIGVEWSSLFVDNGLADMLSYLPYTTVPLKWDVKLKDTKSDAYAFSHRVMIWHVATRYCEIAEAREGSAGGR